MADFFPADFLEFLEFFKHYVSRYILVSQKLKNNLFVHISISCSNKNEYFAMRAFHGKETCNKSETVINLYR